MHRRTFRLLVMFQSLGGQMVLLILLYYKLIINKGESEGRRVKGKGLKNQVRARSHGACGTR